MASLFPAFSFGRSTRSKPLSDDGLPAEIVAALEAQGRRPSKDSINSRRSATDARRGSGDALIRSSSTDLPSIEPISPIDLFSATSESSGSPSSSLQALQHQINEFSNGARFSLDTALEPAATRRTRDSIAMSRSIPLFADSPRLRQTKSVDGLSRARSAGLGVGLPAHGQEKTETGTMTPKTAREIERVPPTAAEKGKRRARTNSRASSYDSPPPAERPGIPGRLSSAKRVNRQRSNSQAQSSVIASAPTLSREGSSADLFPPEQTYVTDLEEVRGNEKSSLAASTSTESTEAVFEDAKEDNFATLRPSGHSQTPDNLKRSTRSPLKSVPSQPSPLPQEVVVDSAGPAPVESPDEPKSQSSFSPTSPSSRSARIHRHHESDISAMSSGPYSPMSSRPGSLSRRSLSHRRENADYTVCVVGPRGSGKSSVIARGCREPLSKASLLAEDGSDREHGLIMEVLEIDSEVLRYEDGVVLWPDYLPSINAAIFCYDATDPNALTSLKQLLYGFWSRGLDIATVVMACKASQGASAVSSSAADHLCKAHSTQLIVLDGGVDDSNGKTRKTMRYLIQAMNKSRGYVPKISASSDASVALPVSQAATIKPSPAMHSFIDFDDDKSEQLSPGKSISSAAMSPSSSSQQETLDLRRVSDASFISTANSSASLVEPVSPAVATSDTSHSNGRPSPKDFDMYLEREVILDKFLFAAVTGNDTAFVSHFLIIYRRFARPGEVLSKLIERYDFLQDRIKTDAVLSRFAQMRLCGVLVRWVEAYPSDFIAPMTQQQLRQFVEDITLSSWVSHYSTELHSQLAIIGVARDLDQGWALPDVAAGEEVLVRTDPSLKVNGGGSEGRSSSGDASSVLATASHSPVNMSSASLVSLGSSTGQSRSQTSSEAAGPDFVHIRHRPIAPSSISEVSNAIVDVHEVDLAQQITRQAWEIYSVMEPRDLIRHVLRDARAANGSLAHQTPVTRSIRYFNYLSSLVATTILCQTSKVKRTLVVAKFVETAWTLKGMDNYDSMMAILAGLNSQPVYRLTNLFEMLPQTTQRRFQSMTKFMGLRGNFANYRTYLPKDSPNLIPYLGCHLQDITRLSEGQKDMKDGLVNLSKHLGVARSASIVANCVRNAPIIPRNAFVDQLIRDVPVLDIGSEELYQRSYMIKPPNAAKKQSALGRAFARVTDS